MGWEELSEVPSSSAWEGSRGRGSFWDPGIPGLSAELPVMLSSHFINVDVWPTSS